MESILELKGIEKRFEGFALGPIDLVIPGGSIMGLIGENGAGKTTTMRLILNLLKPDSGSISIFGMDHIKDEPKVKEDIAVVFDECLFPPILDQRALGKILAGSYKNWDDTLYREYLRKFQLDDNPSRLIKDYSRGMKVKLSLAAALAHRPRLLILDEATAGLDPVVRDEILEVFLNFISDEDHAILMSSHITEDLEKIADYICYIHKGQIVLQDNKDDILENYGRAVFPKTELEKIDRSDLVSIRQSSFGCEALVSDRHGFAAKYPGLMVEKAGLEDIMLFTGKGEKL